MVRAPRSSEIGFFKKPISERSGDPKVWLSKLLEIRNEIKNGVQGLANF